MKKRAKSKKATAKKAAKKKAVKKATKKSAPSAKRRSLAQRIQDSRKELQKAKDKTVRVGRKFFDEAVKEIFKKFKGLQKFSWPEYAPHWNDGDECVFDCYFDSLAINDEMDRGEVDEFYSLEHMYSLLSKKDKEEARIVLELSGANGKDSWVVSQLKSDLEIIKTRKFEEVAEKYEIKKTIKELLESIDKSVYEEMFGEGLVVVTRDGVAVEDYEHD